MSKPVTKARWLTFCVGTGRAGRVEPRHASTARTTIISALAHCSPRHTCGIAVSNVASPSAASTPLTSKPSATPATADNPARRPSVAARPDNNAMLGPGVSSISKTARAKPTISTRAFLP